MTKIVGISGLSGLLLGFSFILLILGEVLQSIRIIFLSLILLSTSNIVLSISLFLYSFYARKENVGWIGSFLSLMGTLGFAGFLLMFFVLGFGWILMGISIYFWKGALPSSNPPVDTGRMEISFDVIAYLLLVAFLPLLIFLSNLRILLAFIFAAFLSLIMKMRDKRLNYVFFISLGISSVISLTYLRQSYRTWLIATLLDTRHLFYSKLNEFYEIRAFNVPLTQIAAEHLFILFLIPFVFYFFTKIRIHNIDLRQTKLASIFLLSLIHIFPVFFLVFVEHLKATYGLVLSILLLPFLTIHFWREKSFTEILKIFIIVFLFYSTVIVYIIVIQIEKVSTSTSRSENLPSIKALKSWKNIDHMSWNMITELIYSQYPSLHPLLGHISVQLWLWTGKALSYAPILPELFTLSLDLTLQSFCTI